MSVTPRSVIVRAPVSMAIGPIPDEVQGPAAIVSFGLAHMTKIFSNNSISAQIDGKQSITTFSLDGEAAKSQTAGGLVLDNRAYRIQPVNGGHQLEISNDLGETFTPAANFVNYDFANAVGDAWVDGRVEKID